MPNLGSISFSDSEQLHGAKSAPHRLRRHTRRSHDNVHRIRALRIGVHPTRGATVSSRYALTLLHPISLSSLSTLDDKMPSLTMPLGNRLSHTGSIPSIPTPIPSPPHFVVHESHPVRPPKRTLSFPQLFAIHNEITGEWFQTKWLTFSDNHQETFLGLNTGASEFSTLQAAIDEYHPGPRGPLTALPECLLLRTKSNAKTVFAPNATLSLDSLMGHTHAQSTDHYKLLAMVGHSDTSSSSSSKVMFYRDLPSNAWFVFYERSAACDAHSNRLSDELQDKLESFIPKQHRSIDFDPSVLMNSPLSVLCNHPMVYVYLGERHKKGK